MHGLLALSSPRPVYISCANEDLWADPRGSYLALYNAVPVFRLYDKNINFPETMPNLNKVTINGKLGFHIREGVHNMLLEDWNKYMDFADIVLK
jgi:hypothetical protein